MPYSWSEPGPDGARRLTLSPHRAMGARGFAAFIALTALLLAVPLLTLTGQPALWFVLAFALPAVWGIWTALRRNQRDLTLSETLTLTRDEARLVRRAPDGTERVWTANPYWVRVTLHPVGGPVEDYLTLKGDGREVELGAFLAPGERRTLAAEIRDAIAALR